jgi:prepilin-type processing-associated H-X9-DG protein
MTEDVGRSEQFFTAKYADPTAIDLLPSGSTFRNAWRWAEPDTSNGISGPPGTPEHPVSNITGGVNGQGGASADNAQFGDTYTIINNSKLPFGGPTYCPWSINNCGPNDEAFSFHGPGCNCLFGDGHVSFIFEGVDAIVFRRLCTPREGIPITDLAGNSYIDY